MEEKNVLFAVVTLFRQKEPETMIRNEIIVLLILCTSPVPELSFITTQGFVAW